MAHLCVQRNKRNKIERHGRLGFLVERQLISGPAQAVTHAHAAGVDNERSCCVCVLVVELTSHSQLDAGSMVSAGSLASALEAHLLNDRLRYSERISIHHQLEWAGCVQADLRCLGVVVEVCVRAPAIANPKLAAEESGGRRHDDVSD